MSIFESNAPPVGERATETAHRKVELQSPADLTYLIANVSRAAREKLDRHLPPDAVPEGEDAMRKRVEQLVDDYIKNTFNAAKHSMSINGMDSREMDAELAKAQEGEEIEPFDTKLAQRIQALSAQIEHHTLQLANLRRNAPSETLQRLQDSFERNSGAYEAQLAKNEQVLLQEAEGMQVVVADIERMDEIHGTWDRSADTLSGLKSELGNTVARMEKARAAVTVVQGK
ncbi:hypothetical protein M433DRAFT_60365 [Acidomyces richmondensis BFW]|nr:MAG: hypothetical protein FE78DRAFT_29667 [Acidomyces sp. 'richmondensis']KYG48803.1 hypothetical protein M433DRAFT_60365 [Acidomyces richmondensis BFW]